MNGYVYGCMDVWMYGCVLLMSGEMPDSGDSRSRAVRYVHTLTLDMLIGCTHVLG